MTACNYCESSLNEVNPRRLTRLRCEKIVQMLHANGEAQTTNNKGVDCIRPDISDGMQSRQTLMKNSNDGNELLIQHNCSNYRNQISELEKKLGECTQERDRAEAELAMVRSENESLINRYDLYCNEHENETSRLKQQLDRAISREKTSKLESSKSLTVLGEQLDAQEKEFVKLTETVRDLLREKIQLQNTLIERESKVRIAESKLERFKESLQMEKLLFMKAHAKDSLVRKFRDRGTQTSCPANEQIKPLEDTGKKTESSVRIMRKDDLEQPSTEANLVRALFFKPSMPYEDANFPHLDILN